MMQDNHWARADKEMVGTNLHTTRVWFTVAGGLLTEVYGPRIDISQLRDLDFIVTSEDGLRVSLAEHARYQLNFPGAGIPAVEAVHNHPRFILRLRIIPDPHRDVMLVEADLQADRSLYLHAVLTPRVGESGLVDRAGKVEQGQFRGVYAEQGPFTVVMMAATVDGRNAVEAVFVGSAEEGGPRALDLFGQGRVPVQEEDRGPGAVRLIVGTTHQTVVAIGLGEHHQSAATLTRAALVRGFDRQWKEYVETWRAWHETYHLSHGIQGLLGEDNIVVTRCLRASTLVLKTHRDRTYPGAMIASLSVPWGEHSASRGGYHLVWPRDLVESATSFLAIGNIIHAQQALCYLVASQQPDGCWYQNQWLGGSPFWDGIQLDEAVFPVLLAGLLDERNALDGLAVKEMVSRALGFLLAHGPITCQDRWEENMGINAFTLAIVIAALIEGGRFLSLDDARFCVEIADEWNAHIEDWLYVRDSELARAQGMAGHYVRIAPPQVMDGQDALDQAIQIHNRDDGAAMPAREHIALDFLQLVRYGLRAPDDPHILESVRLADRVLGVETPAGKVWHRYNGDGYGEKDDGSPYDGTGVGRGWPLLTGERGHYALLAGEDPYPYLVAMARMAGPGGLLPEQVWDQEAIPARGLYPGQPTGGAMPLVWAHAEFIKLASACIEHGPIDRPVRAAAHYEGRIPTSRFNLWHYAWPQETIIRGKPIRFLLPAAGIIHWGINGWQEVRDTSARLTGMGVAWADLDIDPARVHTVEFTIRWADGQWVGRDWRLRLIDPPF